MHLLNKCTNHIVANNFISVSVVNSSAYLDGVSTNIINFVDNNGENSETNISFSQLKGINIKYATIHGESNIITECGLYTN